MLQTIANKLESQIHQHLSKCGLMFRLFSRVKTISSLHHKIHFKDERYLAGKLKIQVLFISDKGHAKKIYIKHKGNFVELKITAPNKNPDKDKILAPFNVKFVPQFESRNYSKINRLNH